MRTHKSDRSRLTGAAVILVVACFGLSGCIPPPTSEATKVAPISKHTFLVQLVGFCKQVNDRLASAAKGAAGSTAGGANTGTSTASATTTETAGPTTTSGGGTTGSSPSGTTATTPSGQPPPGRIADELEGLVKKVLSGPTPTQDRQKLDSLVSALLNAAAKQHAYQAALDSKQVSAIASAEDAAGLAMKQADEAAVAYGMPHLTDCGKKGPPPVGPAGGVGTWQTGPDAKEAVQQAATAVLDDRIWVLGGLTSAQTATAKVMLYDPTLNAWSWGPELPAPLHHAMAVTYRNELYVIGGYIPEGGEVSAIASDRVYRLHEGRWEQLASLHHARAAGAAGVVGDRIVVVGGRDADNNLVSVTEIFDGTGWRDAAPIPVPLEHLAAVSDGSALYAVGGRNLSAGQNSPALQRYDPGTNTWKRLQNMPIPCGDLGAAIVDGQIIAVGGEDLTSVYGSVETYDIAGEAWSTTQPNLPSPRHGMGVVAVGSHLYAIAGGSRPGHASATATMAEIDLKPPATETPTSSPSSTAPTIYQCPTDGQSAKRACLRSAVLVDGRLVIAYWTNFQPSHTQDAAHLHLHFFTASARGRSATTPDASMMQLGAARKGSWFNVYSNGVKVIDNTTEKGGLQRPLNTRAALLCVRVATGAHDLFKDKSGGIRTGNCVNIRH
jgi:N-acetylneuraminic acid mutarotase